MMMMVMMMMIMIREDDLRVGGQWRKDATLGSRGN
jgi:hypothetical protein